VGNWLNWYTVLAYILGAFTGGWLMSLAGRAKSKVA
jgi:hypothetical protein